MKTDGKRVNSLELSTSKDSASKRAGEAAARAYDAAARKYHGEFARLNFAEGEGGKTV